MPKSGLSPKEWWARLRAYAAGEFTFRKGQKPPKTSKWHDLIVKIDACPCQKRIFGVNRTIFGGVPVCSCGFHKKQVVTPVPRPRPVIPEQTAVRPGVASGTATESTVMSVVPPVTVTGPASTGFTSDAVHSLGTTATVVASQPGDSSETGVLPFSVSMGMTIPYADRLPQGWALTMSPDDCAWAGKTLFTDKGRLRDDICLWWYPPTPSPTPGHPKPGPYFLKKLLLWIPRRLFSIGFKCPNCGEHLRSKGLYRRIRTVLAMDDFFYMAGENLECGKCKLSILSWDNRLLQQLPAEIRALFPVTLTWKAACSDSIVGLLRSRTLGNSSTALQHSVEEEHTKNWAYKQMLYLADCDRHRRGREAQRLPPVTYQKAPPFTPLHCARWFQACYIRDIWSRLETVKAQVTSAVGAILKIDSTKKVTKKLQGVAAGSASWVTSVGNERGQILTCIVTTSESKDSLQPMADGLMKRFTDIKEKQPLILYTDRDCCSASGPSKYQALFHQWEGLIVKLDIFHFMRRITLGCSTESHPLYPVFMRRLCQSIFEWDPTDMERLCMAKRGELIADGVADPSGTAIHNNITKKEMAVHCRRRTRPKAKIRQLIEELIKSLSTATDTLGVYLLKDEMNFIWAEQKHHLGCIEDPVGVNLYTVTRHITKGGVRLPVYKCSRGSSSLESFHLHLARFIPGTAANAVNFQGFLLDGLARWNILRASEAVKPADVYGLSAKKLRLFDAEFQSRANFLSQRVHGEELFSQHQAPRTYTGELLGLDYLYQQSELQLPSSHDDVDGEIDEGFVDNPDSAPDEVTDETDETVFVPEQTVEEVLDSQGVPGWDKVRALASVLANIPSTGVSSALAEKIIALWEELPDFDKKPLQYRASPDKPVRGRFSRSKNPGYPGQELMKRCFVTGGAPSRLPSESRLVDSMCIVLMEKTFSPRKDQPSRFKQVVSRYNEIKMCVANCRPLTDRTGITLFHINETTVSKWYKNKTRKEEEATLLMGRQLPNPRMCSRDELAAPLHLQESAHLTQQPGVATFEGSSHVGTISVSRPTTRAKRLFQEQSLVAAAAQNPVLPAQNPFPPAQNPFPPAQNPFPTGPPQSQAIHDPFGTAGRENPVFALPDPNPTVSVEEVVTFQPSMLVPGPQPMPAPAASQPDVSQPSTVSPVASQLQQASALPVTTQHQPLSRQSLPAPVPILPLAAPSVSGPAPRPGLSRTTMWRRRKALKEIGLVADTQRKSHCCSICRMPLKSEGHTQFRGHRYCPHASGQIPKEEWLVKMRSQMTKK